MGIIFIPYFVSAATIEKQDIIELRDTVNDLKQRLEELKNKLDGLIDNFDRDNISQVKEQLKHRTDRNNLLNKRPIENKKWTNQYDFYFKKYSKRYFGIGFDWYWFKSQALAESALKENAESWVGAKGLMQLMPNTFKEIQSKFPEHVNINSPKWNISAGIFYNRRLYDEWTAKRPFFDRLAFMFASYNAGLGNILKGQKICNKKNIGNCNLWTNITIVADQVNTWKSEETLHYVVRIFKFMGIKNF